MPQVMHTRLITLIFMGVICVYVLARSPLYHLALHLLASNDVLLLYVKVSRALLLSRFGLLCKKQTKTLSERSKSTGSG